MAEIEKVQETAESEMEVASGILQRKLDLEAAKARFMKRRKRYIRLAVLGAVLLFLIFFALYINSSKANVASIRISGNDFLSDEYILQETGISTKSKYMFLFPSFKEQAAEKSPLIESVDIERGSNHTVIIKVKENKIRGYRFNGSAMELVLADGQFVPFESRFVTNIAVFPLFVNMADEKCQKVVTELNKLDDDIIMRIAEIRDFALSYDNDMVKFVMDDNYKVYCSVRGIPLLNEYLNIIVNTTSHNSCIYLDENQNVAQIRDCKDFEGPVQPLEEGKQ